MKLNIVRVRGVHPVIETFDLVLLQRGEYSVQNIAWLQPVARCAASQVLAPLFEGSLDIVKGVHNLLLLSLLPVQLGRSERVGCSLKRSDEAGAGALRRENGWVWNRSGQIGAS